MAVQSINIGTIANDGSGDSLRVAFDKVNQNFNELDGRFSFTNSVENLGNGTALYHTKENNVLYFKTLVGGTNVSLSATDNEVTINSDENFTIQADNDSVNISGAGKNFGIKGIGNIDTAISGTDINVSIDPVGLVALDTSPTLGGNLDAGNFSITNASSITASTFTGNLVGTVNGVALDNTLANLDLGGIVYNITSMAEYILSTTDIDYGTFTSPGSINSDFESIVS